MTFVLSVLASITDQNGVFVAQRRRFRVIILSSIAFGCLKLRGKESQRRCWKQIGGSANQKSSYQDKSIGQSNRSRPRRKDKVPFSSNQIRLTRRQVGRIVIRTRLLFRSIRFLWRDLQTDHLRLVQSNPSDRISEKTSIDSSHFNGHGPHK